MNNLSTDFFKNGVLDLIDEKSLRDRLASGEKLRIKFGVDPTRPDIHLGHAVVLWKLKALQDAGHTIIFLIGDYTTKIGDPSGVNTTRPILSDSEIKVNADTYFEQVGKILDIDKTEIRYNSEWFADLSFAEILQITAKFTVSSILERDDFQKRLSGNTEIGLHELLYPVMQAYDSVMLRADIEVGGSDQRFNILAGRSYQKKTGQKPQDIMIFKLLVGTDGKIKMSKSKDNYIAITESADNMFGKIMSIPDSALMEYFELAANYGEAKLLEIKKRLDGENPKEIKMLLATEIVTIYHGDAAAKAAKDEFTRVFSNREVSANVIEVSLSGKEYLPIDLIVALDTTVSRSDARRLVEQGGLKIDSVKITALDETIKLAVGTIVQIGKLRVYKIR
ncbi:MAG: tyrosine--tRNA ligase [Candidatus Berkelbacteria bacterium]